MEQIVKRKKHKALRVLGITLAGVVLLGTGGYFYAATHTQVVVGLLQRMSANGKPLNSYEPLNPPMRAEKENGQYLISELAYGTEYPNSFLDVIYPNSDLTADRPTLFYFHGGGFFAGSKNMGDPLASSEATELLDDLCAQGYNIVNVDYALVPDYRFPVPLIQMNQAIAFAMEHRDEYHLNMDKIVLMGSSAGAIMVAQYAAAASNEDYAHLLGFSPVLQAAQISAVVVDDAPLDYDSFSLGCKFLIGNYVKDSIYLSRDEISRYNCIEHLTADYPPVVLLGSEYRHDMNLMHEGLEELGVEHLRIDPYAEHGTQKPHCFMASERSDPIAKEAFERTVAFLAQKTEGAS